MMKKWNKFWRIFFNEVIKILKNLFHFWSIFLMKNCLTESKYWVALVNLSPNLLPDSSSFLFRVDFLNSFQTHGEYFLHCWRVYFALWKCLLKHIIICICLLSFLVLLSYLSKSPAFFKSILYVISLACFDQNKYQGRLAKFAQINNLCLGRNTSK